jgi:hypothetical protein
MVLASVVPAWRRTPLTALPALVATLPWWPVALPAVALVWTGPLAWLPILAALATAEGSRWLGALGRAAGAHVPGRGIVLAGLCTLALGIVTLSAMRPNLPGGDEPHYLVITQSLWLDGDLRIENNHARRDFAEYTWLDLRPHFVNRGKDGRIYSIHAPGVSALVLPGFALFGLVGAQVTILLCLVITAMLVWRLAWRATNDAGAAWFAWAAVAGSATTVLLGVMVFPDSPAALATAAALWWLVSVAHAGDPVRSRPLMVVSTTLAALPWLHTRFAVLAAALGITIIITLLTDRRAVLRVRMSRVATFMAVPLISAGAWFLSFWLIYGTIDPRAPYRGAESLRDWIWGAVVGLYADQQFGLFAFAPVLVAALVGAFRTQGRSLRWLCVASGATLVTYTVAVASYHMWWAGIPGLPARFLTATIPLFALPLAIGWARATSGGRAVLLALLGITWLITAIVVFHDHGTFAFNGRDGQTPWLEWLSPVVNLPRGWPSFFWRTQGDFLQHIATLAALALVWVGGWFAMRGLARPVVAVWMLAGLMGGVEAGWRLNGVSGLDPVRSQVAAHGAPRTWRVAPLSVSRFRTPEALTMRTDEFPLTDRPSNLVMLLGPLPAGLYRLHVEGEVSREMVVTARIGRSLTPLGEWALSPGEAAPLPVTLPAGAGAFVLEADSPESAAELQVTLRPAGRAIPTFGFARIQVKDEHADVYFSDDHTFLDDEGFWVRGGREAAVAWSSGSAAAGRTRRLTLRNGEVPNEVTVRMDGWFVTMRLGPGETRDVLLPAADATGTWRTSIQSVSGYQPSAVSDSADDRYLGVWVKR